MIHLSSLQTMCYQAPQMFNNCYSPDVFVSCTNFSIQSGERILIQLIKPNSQPVNHECENISPNAAQLSVTVQNNQENSVAIKKKDPLTKLLILNQISHNLCFLKPCFPLFLPDYHCLNFIGHPFYLDLPRFKYNIYDLDDNDIEDGKGFSMPLKEKYFSSSSLINIYNPRNIIIQRPFVIMPKQHFLVKITTENYPLFTFNCSNHSMHICNSDFLGLIVHNNSEKDKIPIHSLSNVLDILSHPLISHQLCRFHTIPRKPYECNLM